MENSKIEWCDHTFNPWLGCTKVSPGCANCYAENLMDTRMHIVEWGKGKPRKRTTVQTWNAALKWNREAAEARMLYDSEPSYFHLGEPPPRRPRVFCASLADWLDDEVPAEWLADLLDLWGMCKYVDILALTKRPQNWRKRVEAAYKTGCYGIGTAGHDLMQNWLDGSPPSNVWVGTSVEDQQRADERIPELLKIPAKIRFLSCEPLLGPVDLVPYLFIDDPRPIPLEIFPRRGSTEPCLDWVIGGGESGNGARPMHPDWPRSLRDQCKAAGVAFLFKQWGEWLPQCQYQEGVHTNPINHTGVSFDHDNLFYKVGKKAAGRLLDGVEHNEYPT